MIRRYFLFAVCYALMPAILIGLLVVYVKLGLGTLCGAVALLYLVCFGNDQTLLIGGLDNGRCNSLRTPSRASDR
jgi:hypothetical protein